VDGDLMMIQGPLALRWLAHGRMIPRLDTGEIAWYDLPTLERVRLWLRTAPRVGDHIFIKLFTHGAQEQNLQALLNGGLDTLFRVFAAECRRRGYRFYYATARQMWEAIESIRKGETPSRTVCGRPL
jgi:hypothetical protein